MEKTIEILIYVHIFFGGIGLAAGIGSVISRPVLPRLATWIMPCFSRPI